VNWRRIVRRALPKGLRTLALRHVERGFRYKQVRQSPTDYLAEFDHRSLRRAKASILWFDNWDTATRDTVQILAEVGVVRDGFSLIDYGCGIGRISRALAETYRVRVLAVDRSREMLRHAARYVPRRFIDGGAVRLMSDQDLIDQHQGLAAKFDSILFIEVLQHIPEPILDDLLPSMWNLLKPHGRIFVFGNRVLDVDRSGSLPPATGVRDVLRRYGRIVQEDTWSRGFSAPRYSFLLAQSTSPPLP